MPKYAEVFQKKSVLVQDNNSPTQLGLEEFVYTVKVNDRPSTALYPSRTGFLST